jgi:molecular chaperone GrpE
VEQLQLETEKARLRERFETWLAALEPESFPASVDASLFASADEAESGSDLYSLWEAVTTLSQEVRLQGRAFKQLGDGLTPLVERQTAVLGAHAEALAEARRLGAQAAAARSQREQQAQIDARRDALEALLDTRDRLSRAAAQAGPILADARSALAPRWLGLLPVHPTTARTLEAASALEEGARLALARVDEAMDRLGVRPISGVGEPFDPERMEAVEVAQRSDVAEGSVLEVYRSGYQCAGVVLRTAQVKVARSRA